MINESSDNACSTAWNKMYKAITDEMEIYEAKCTRRWIKPINYNILKWNVQIYNYE